MRKFHDTYDEEETVWSLKPSVAPALNNLIQYSKHLPTGLLIILTTVLPGVS